MSLFCPCPQSASIDTVPDNDCPEYMGQIHKIILQRETQADGTVNTITVATTNPNALATWSTLKSASDYTKVSISPFIDNSAIAPGGVIEYGGGNETRNGITIPITSEFTQCTGDLLNIKQSVIKVLKKFGCESISETGLAVFLISSNGTIWGKSTDSGTTFQGIPARSFFVGDKMSGNRLEPDKNSIQWAFDPNWSDDLYSVTPVTGFNPLRDL